MCASLLRGTRANRPWRRVHPIAKAEIQCHASLAAVPRYSLDRGISIRCFQRENFLRSHCKRCPYSRSTGHLLKANARRLAESALAAGYFLLLLISNLYSMAIAWEESGTLRRGHSHHRREYCRFLRRIGHLYARESDTGHLFEHRKDIIAHKQPVFFSLDILDTSGVQLLGSKRVNHQASRERARKTLDNVSTDRRRKRSRDSHSSVFVSCSTRIRDAAHKKWCRVLSHLLTDAPREEEKVDSNWVRIRFNDLTERRGSGTWHSRLESDQRRRSSQSLLFLSLALWCNDGYKCPSSLTRRFSPLQCSTLGKEIWYHPSSSAITFPESDSVRALKLYSARIFSVWHWRTVYGHRKEVGAS